jgi:hypothetical protein
MTIQLIHAWDLWLLFFLAFIALSGLCAYIASYHWINATRVSQAIDTVFTYLWSRRITALEPWHHAQEAYKVLGPSAKENCRR